MLGPLGLYLELGMLEGSVGWYRFLASSRRWYSSVSSCIRVDCVLRFPYTARDALPQTSELEKRPNADDWPFPEV